MYSIPTIWWLAPIAALIALIAARLLHARLMLESEGTDQMKEIAGHVKEGAMAYLRQQYRIVGIVNHPGGNRNPVLGYEVLGDDSDLPELLKKYPIALITLG